MSDFKAIDNLTKDYSTKPVPVEKQTAGWPIFAVWVGGIISVPIIMVGITLALSMPLKEALVSIVLGQIILAMIAGLTAYVGVKTHLSTAMILRVVFGKFGSHIPTIFISLALLGWFGFQAEIFGQSFQKALLNTVNIDVSVDVLTIIGAIMMSTTAIIGFKALNILSQITTPLLFLLLCLPLWTLFGDQGVNVLRDYEVDQTLSIGAAISMIIGSWAVGASVTPDISRFGKSVKAGAGATFFAFSIAAIILLVMSMALVVVSGKSDFTEIMYAAGWGVPAMIVLMIATWTTNDTNLYLSSLSLTAVFQKYRKWQVATFCAVIGTIIAVAGVVEHFIQWLIFMGVAFAPAAGVYVTSFVFERKRFEGIDFDQLPKVNVKPFISWIFGAFVGFCALPADGVGLGTFSLTTIPALDAIIASALINTTLLKVFPDK